MRPPLDTTPGRNFEIHTFILTHRTGALSVIGFGEEPLISTIDYVTDKPGSLIFKSRNGSEHSLALRDNPRASFAMYDDVRSSYEKYGVQLKGIVERISTIEEIEHVRTLYEAHAYLSEALHDFSVPSAFIGETKVGFYRFLIWQQKLVDTRAGKNVYSAWEPTYVTHINRMDVGFVPLCGSLRGPVNRWPKQHRLVPFKELEQVTCPLCKRRADKLETRV